MTDTERTELLVQISNSFGQMRRAMHVFIGQDYSKLGLSLSQLMVLKTINRLQPVSHKVVAQNLLMTPGAISQLLDGLDSAGCIQRVPDPADRRVNYLSLSDHGKEVVHKFHKLHLQLLSKACTDTSDEDLQTYARVQLSMASWLEDQTPKEN